MRRLPRRSADEVRHLRAAGRVVAEMHEPMVWWAKFGEGRVVTTSMGHLWVGDKTFEALHCVGFQTILARSTEWAATGKVTLPVPEGFPTKDQTSVIEPSKVVWKK